MSSTKLETFARVPVFIKWALNFVVAWWWSFLELFWDPVSTCFGSDTEAWCLLFIDQAHGDRWWKVVVFIYILLPHWYLYRLPGRLWKAIHLFRSAIINWIHSSKVLVRIITYNCFEHVSTCNCSSFPWWAIFRVKTRRSRSLWASHCLVTIENRPFTISSHLSGWGCIWSRFERSTKNLSWLSWFIWSSVSIILPLSLLTVVIRSRGWKSLPNIRALLCKSRINDSLMFSRLGSHSVSSRSLWLLSTTWIGHNISDLSCFIVKTLLIWEYLTCFRFWEGLSFDRLLTTLSSSWNRCALTNTSIYILINTWLVLDVNTDQFVDLRLLRI